MSLINEALKRARAEADEREARRAGRPLPSPIAPPYAPSRGQRPLSILAILGGIFLVGLLAGAITYVRNRAAAPPTDPAVELADSTVGAVGPEAPREVDREGSRGILAAAAPPADSAPPATAESAPRPEPTQPPRSRDAATLETPRIDPDGRPAAVAPNRESTTPPSSPTQTTAVRPRADAADTEPGRPAARDAARAPQPPQKAAVTGSVMAGVREATAADGRVLALGGIAWSASGPFALINGRVLATGERVEGFEVMEIEKERVRLEEGDETIVLKLR